MASEPYPPQQAPPAGTTLESILSAPTTTDAAGHVMLGKMRFESPGDLALFKLNQERLAQSTHGATSEQLGALRQVIDNGRIPDSQPMTPPPAGTTIHQLLTSSSSRPDANGFFHFGNLRVGADVVDAFRTAERSLAAKDPEAVAALYHLEHGARPASIAKVAGNDYTLDRSIYWDPGKAGVDPASGMKAPASVTLLHEQTHALGGIVGDTMPGIPRAGYDNLEEQRVIDGTERRAMDRLHLTPRHSHGANLVEAPSVTSTDHLGRPAKPELHVDAGGKERLVPHGYQQTGRVISVDVAADRVTLATGRPPETSYRISELANDKRHGDPMSVLQNAKDRGDSLHIEFTRNGEIRMTDVGRTAPTQQHGVPSRGETPVPELHRSR